MPKQTSPRLLVVDDDLGVIAAYRHVLEGNGPSRDCGPSTFEDELFGRVNKQTAGEFDWRVDFVDQGDDAVVAVRKAVSDLDPFSILFLDVRMPPGIDGYETAREIRKIDQNVHIVFVSAFADYTDGELSEAAGPEDKSSFLPKPVWPDELRAAAIELCQKAKTVAHARKQKLNRA